MNYKETIRRCMRERNMTQKTLARKSGFKSDKNIMQALLPNRNNITLEKLVSLLDAMDYQLVVMDKNDRRNKWELNGIPKEEEK